MSIGAPISACLFAVRPDKDDCRDDGQAEQSDFRIYRHEIDEQGRVAEQIDADQDQTPLSAPHLPDCPQADRQTHEQDEAEIGERGEADEICIAFGNEALGIGERLGRFATKCPPAHRLSDHQQADADADQTGCEEDKADGDGEFAFHTVLLW